MAVGRIERVELRDVWLHEALDLTPWLLENADVLACQRRLKTAR
jgi:hypothetical protein